MSTQLTVSILENEFWWGGAVHHGYKMPIGKDSELSVDPGASDSCDQCASVYVSSRGRYLWSDKPFTLHAAQGTLHLEGMADIQLNDGYGNLKGAYQATSEHFPFSAYLPDKRFFSQPQYNTWIELGTEQTTRGILRYARGILSHDLPAGILMIDEGWAEDYGVFEFNRRKIPNPKALIASLHDLGFSVMLWVTPNVSCAGQRFQELLRKGYLVLTSDGSPAIRRWWNGYSAVLDLTNPEAYAWYCSQLDGLIARYHVDGFKFDAGDSYFYRDDDQIFQTMPALEQTRMYNRLGEKYPLNEFRAAWNYGGRPIVSRLQDKFHSWDHFGINTLIPHTILQGLLGYAYCCPDMVGGGSIDCFGKENKLDQELFVRWAQASACMGMMQMSIAPWRVLDHEHAALVQDAMQLHAQLGEQIWQLAQHAARTGEPVVRHMAYEFPDEGFERISDQFMLGRELLLAPVLTPSATSRSIRLPHGRWEDWKGRCYEGGQTIEVPVELSDIPRFVRL